MKSAVFCGAHTLKVQKSPVPKLEPDGVLVRVMACGICGTDVHIYEGDKGAADTTPPVILGHEFSGIVEAVGEKVSRVKAGDRVCIDPNKLCGACPYCRTGIGHFCENMVGIGTTVDGGFAEYCAVPESQVYRLAAGTSFEEGAMAEPLACCLHGIDLCEIRPGSAVMVIGAGMIGLLMVQLAKLSGARLVAVLEPVEEKRIMALKLGADLCADPFHEDVPGLLKKNGVERFDTVIECAGLPSTIEQAISYAGKKSVVMMFGLTKPDDTIAVRPFELFQKEIVLKASFINPYTQQRAVDLINARRIDVSSMVAGFYGLEELERVLADPKLRAKGKYIIKP